jgi:sugar lactone lactonase YvrE
MKPELIADYACETGEGPLWHPIEKRLYWADIPPGKIFRYDPATGQHAQIIDAGEAIGGFTFQADGSLLLFMAKGRIAIWREGKPLENIIDEIPAMRESRFNDVIADPAGRVFCGTMPLGGERMGILYRLDTDGSLHVALEDAGLSNGMGFTDDLKTLYHTDTRRRAITRYAYDLTSGALSQPEVIVREGAQASGHPDGMTVDAANCLWSARWDGYALVHHMPNGREIQRITFPTPKVSSVTFGGDNYTDMYVTTAGGRIREKDGPQAGVLYRINLGVKGKPAFLSRIGL